MWKIRSVMLRTIGYRPSLFWDAWAIDFDMDQEQLVLHPWNVMALELIREAEPDTVLEIGCGFGRNMKELIRGGLNPENLYGVDISKKMLKKCRVFLDDQRVHLHHAEIESLPFLDKSIDVAYVSLVLMHTPPSSVTGAVAEVVRVARKRVVFLEEHRQEKPGIITQQINDFTFAHDYRTYLSKMGLCTSIWHVAEKWCVFTVDL
jgi:ubiquinone/menaquinone biosynthesis C-methylase UbiE